MWDFGESNYFSDASRTWKSALESIEKVIDCTSQARMKAGQVQQVDACRHPLPDASASIFFTDPPYYFAIPYADLSTSSLFG